MSNIIHGFTKPEVADFTLLNTTAGSSVTDSVEGIHWKAVNTNNSLNESTILAKTAPSTPWKATAHILNKSVYAYYMKYGMCFRQTSNGYIETFWSGPGNSAGTAKIHDTEFSQENWTGYSASLDSFTFPTALWDQNWFQLEDDGTNKYFRLSSDGINWVTKVTKSRTTFLTPDQVGIIVAPRWQDVYVSIKSFKLEVG